MIVNEFMFWCMTAVFMVALVALGSCIEEWIRARACGNTWRDSARSWEATSEEWKDKYLAAERELLEHRKIIDESSRMLADLKKNENTLKYPRDKAMAVRGALLFVKPEQESIDNGRGGF